MLVLFIYAIPSLDATSVCNTWRRVRMRKNQNTLCARILLPWRYLCSVLLPYGSDLFRRDTESGHNMCDEEGKGNLQVGKAPLYDEA